MRFAAKSTSLLSKVTMLGAALLLTGATAQAQDYSVFNTILQQQGTPSEDGTQITYALVRQDLGALTVKLYGQPATPAAPEGVANGYIGLQQIGSTSSYFVDGSFPALPAELPVLEAALELVGVPVTAITDDTAGLSKAVFHVHVEGTVAAPNAAALATGLATALATIKNPQVGVSIVYPGVVYPSVPKKFLNIVQNGVFRLVDNNAVVYSIGRSDVTPITLGSILATPSVGVGETITITGNGSSSVINAELALTKAQVATVQEYLIAAGFTLSSQADYFNDDSKRLVFLHATATAQDQATFYLQAEQLGLALVKVVK